jgi:hypothetical protein
MRTPYKIAALEEAGRHLHEIARHLPEDGQASEYRKIADALYRRAAAQKKQAPAQRQKGH